MEDDVQELRDLPANADVVTAGFPCADLSQPGRQALLLLLSQLQERDAVLPGTASTPAAAALVTVALTTV